MKPTITCNGIVYRGIQSPSLLFCVASTLLLEKRKPLLPSCHVVLNSIDVFLILAILPMDILLLKVHNTLLLLIPVCGHKTKSKK